MTKKISKKKSSKTAPKVDLQKLIVKVLPKVEEFEDIVEFAPKLKISKDELKKQFLTYAVSCATKAEKKIPKLEAEWHLIGHLQRNKVAKALKLFEVIQSIDSLKLAEKINKLTKKKQKIMLQLKFGGRYGFEPKKFNSILKEIKQMENLNLIGVMMIANKNKPEKDFKKAQKIFSKSGLRFLSMGMSNDYKLAMKYGSNMLRIGRGIFHG